MGIADIHCDVGYGGYHCWSHWVTVGIADTHFNQSLTDSIALCNALNYFPMYYNKEVLLFMMKFDFRKGCLSSFTREDQPYFSLLKTGEGSFNRRKY